MYFNSAASREAAPHECETKLLVSCIYGMQEEVDLLQLMHTYAVFLPVERRAREVQQKLDRALHRGIIVRKHQVKETKIT
jgi:hypothetical protein